MSQEITPYLIRPNSLTEAMELSKMISTSNFCPKEMRGKPGDVLLALQMGSEVGLSPMQSLQNVTVINGKPCIWGDGALAVVQVSPAYEYHKEFYTGTVEDQTRTAHCVVKRKGSPEYSKSFSMLEAKKAGLWSKSGVWQQYPERMLQMRARAFAIRDQFADALKGLQIREEVQDYQMPKPALEVVQAPPPVDSLKKYLLDEKPEFSLEEYLQDMRTSLTMDDLKDAFYTAYRAYPHDLKTIQTVKDERKRQIESDVIAFLDEITEAENKDVTYEKPVFNL